MEQEERFETAGFRFASAQDAQRAEAELHKIQYLESKIDYGDLRKVQAIYEKAVKEQVFQTAVGLFYLKGIRDFLVREDERYETVLPCLPISLGGTLKNGTDKMQDVGAKTKTASQKREEKRKLELTQSRQRLRVSVVLNVVLAVAVAAMFWIALHSEQPNILNYETAVRNKYASWEQELTQREQELRRHELESYRDD